MKRVTKFRVWDGKILRYPDECNYEWSVGICGEVIDPWSNIKDEYVLQQFVGIKDKSGKDIYEGDIVKVKRCHCINVEKSKGVISVELVEDGEEVGCIFWSDPLFRFSVSYEHMRYDDCEDLMGNDSRYEIIGNVFETPNLLLEHPHKL